MQLADGRPLVFAGLFLPVLGWVAFNIGAPALRQIDAMGDKGAAPKKAAAKKRAVIAGLTGLTAAALMAAPESADAAQARSAASERARKRPAVAAFESTQPHRRRTPALARALTAHAAHCALRRAHAAPGSGADAARCAPFVSQEMLQVADGRPLVFAGLFLPVLGWVAFNIGAPALRQIDAMGDKGAAPAKKATKKRAVIAGLTGLSAAALLAAPEAAQAAQVRRARRCRRAARSPHARYAQILPRGLPFSRSR